jgi:hypothetical protein
MTLFVFVSLEWEFPVMLTFDFPPPPFLEIHFFRNFSPPLSKGLSKQKSSPNVGDFFKRHTPGAMLRAVTLLSIWLFLTGAGASEDDEFLLLSPSLQCSACEVVSGLLFNHSEELGFGPPSRAGLQQLADKECPLLRTRLKLGQQAFAAHLKIFIPRETKFDMVTYEPPEFYSDSEHEAARPALRVLSQKCVEMVRLDGESALKELSESEAVTRDFFAKHFCRLHRNDCSDDVLKAERDSALLRRRAWKKMSKKHRRDSTALRSQHEEEL